MIRTVKTLIVLMIVSTGAMAQVGIGTENPNAKSVLDLQSPGNNQGLLVPRLTTAQRTSITGLTAGEKGLLVFDLDTNKFYYWSGSAWIVIEDSTGTDSQTLSYTASTGSLTITGGNSVNLTGTTPGGSAGNDLTGTYPNPSVANNAITSAKIADGTIVNADVNNSAAIAVSKLASGSNGQILTTTAGVPTWSLMPAPSGTAGGDLSGTYPNPSVAQIQGRAVTNTAPTTNQILKWNGTAWAPQADAQGITSITAGTGLSGGTIISTGTIAIAANGVTATELRSDAATDANRAVTANHIRDNAITTAKITDGSVTSAKLSNSGVTAGVYGSATLVPRIQVDAQGRITVASNVTIAGVAPGGAAGGDLTGTYPNPAVTTGAITSAKILDGTVATADLADGSVTSAKIFDATIATADLANGAVTDIKIANVAPGKILQGGALTGQVLKWNGGAWAPGVDNTGGGGVGGSGTAGQVAFWTGTSNIAGNNNLLWDEKDSRLGIGLPPQFNFHFGGSHGVVFTIAGQGNYLVDPKDYVIIADPETNEILLPDADAERGRILIIRASGAKAVTIRSASGKDTIDQQAGIQISAADNGSLYCITLIAVGSGNWFTLNKARL